MKIILLNLFDAFLPAYLLSYFSDHTWEKHSKLPYYSVLAIYIVGYISYNALTLHLTGNTSNFATVIRICVSIILHYYLAFYFLLISEPESFYQSNTVYLVLFLKIFHILSQQVYIPIIL